jgi:CRISPR type III-A-associated RAMP protein Csm4
MALIEVRLRPTTPWRVGHGAGDRERVDVVYRSDALYSAVTHAMKTLGWLDEWLAATAHSTGEPVVRFSSLFPFIGKTRLVAPPKTWWPPANPGRLYTEAAKLIPLEVVRNGIVDESRWMVDGETGCMFHTGSGAPVKIVVRTAAAIDRLTGVADPHRIACLEFAPNAGWWGCFAVEDAEWEARVKAAFRLLADSGFGGERSRGWGRAAAPEFSDASSLLPSRVNEDGAWWLLSVYSPDASDAVDWSRGEYAATQRGGWTDSQDGVAPKKQVRVIEEGSVLYAPSLRGRAVDVAPEGFAHPVYRAGFALAVLAPPEPAMRQQPVAAPEAVLEEVAIPAEFEAGVHHEPQGEPCDEPIHAEVPIPAEFEAGVHHEPHGEPCDEPIHAEVPIPAEFEAGIPVETPAEVAEEVEAEAEMVFEGAPPEPPVRAEAEPETTEADAHIGSPDEELL